MPDYTIKKFEEMESAFGGTIIRARAELGVTSFGMNVMNLQPEGFYPHHDHAKDQQEEVYIALHGSAEFDIEGEKVTLEPGSALRIPAGVDRHVTPAKGGCKMLALGGVPGGVYTAPEFTEIGGPEPTPPGLEEHLAKMAAQA